MNTTDTRHEIRTEKVEMSFKDGATSTVFKKTIIEEEKANPLIIIIGTFIVFLVSSYCLVQLLNSQRDNHYEIQSRQFNEEDSIIHSYSHNLNTNEVKRVTVHGGRTPLTIPVA